MTTIRVSAKALKAVSRASATQDIRYYLNGVLTEATKHGTTLVATNGHQMIAVHQDVINDVGDETVALIIPTSVVKLLISKASKDGSPIEITQIGDKWNVPLPPDNELNISVKAIEGHFPDWRKVIPETVSGDAASYQAQYIKRIQDAAIDLAPRGRPIPISITHNGQRGGVITCPLLEDFGFIGVVMPMHVMESGYASPPKWAAKPPEPEAAEQAVAADEPHAQQPDVREEELAEEAVA